jgi:hypothetical protein
MLQVNLTSSNQSKSGNPNSEDLQESSESIIFDNKSQDAPSLEELQKIIDEAVAEQQEVNNKIGYSVGDILAPGIDDMFSEFGLVDEQLVYVKTAVFTLLQEFIDLRLEHVIPDVIFERLNELKSKRKISEEGLAGVLYIVYQAIAKEPLTVFSMKASKYAIDIVKKIFEENRENLEKLKDFSDDQKEAFINAIDRGDMEKAVNMFK